MHRGLLVLLVVIPLLAPEPGTAHFGSVPSEAAATPKKKAKAKKCRRTQVRVKVGRRRTCRPLRKVFPRPKAGDPRKLFTQSVIRSDYSRLRNRRGKRVPSLPKLIRRVGPRAPALLARAAKRGISRLDALETGATATRLARHSQAGQGCASIGQAPRTRDNFTSRSSDGTSASVGVELGPEGGSIGIDLTGNEFSVSVDIDMGLCDPNEVEAPSCPTAVGQLDGQIRYKFKVAIQVSRGNEDVWSQATEVTRKTKLVGFNEVDAKLDGLDVEDVESSTLRLGGSTRDFPPMTIRTKITRMTRVDMRSGAYDPGRSRVDASISMDGLFGPDRDDAEAEFERKTQQDADRQFRAVVDKAIGGYRSREEGWQEPNRCASLKFSPASNTLTLRGGASGNFSATALAKSDGGISELDARLTEMQLAQFSPTRAGGQGAQFTYGNVAPGAPPGSKVRAKVHATSKAGVAEGTWEQNIQPPFEINQISGNFSGSHTSPGGGRTSRVTWTGSATFKRQTPAGFPGAAGTYILTAGQASYHFSGGTITQHAACDMSGSTFVDLFQDGGGSLGVSPVDDTKIFEQGPHDYSGDAYLGPEPRVTLTMQNCAPGAESEEGKTYEYPVGFPPIEMGGEEHRSPDGINYNGSYSQSEGDITTEWTWVLTGEKASQTP